MTGDHDPMHVDVLSGVLAIPDFFVRLFDDDISLDWGLTLHLGEYLASPPVSNECGYLFMARAARHLGDRSRAIEALSKFEQAIFLPGVPVSDAEDFASVVAYERSLLSGNVVAPGSALVGRPNPYR